MIRDYPDLLVVRSFSKSRALAGLRVGAAFGQPHLIEELRRVKDSFNSYPPGHLEIAGAVALLEDEAYFQTRRAQVMATRERLAERLRSLGFDALPSATNFLVRHCKSPGNDN